MAESCKTCRFWDRNTSLEGRPGLRDLANHSGRCRRLPPHLLGNETAEDARRSSNLAWAFHATHFPVTAAGEWCGEYQRRGDM